MKRFTILLAAIIMIAFVSTSCKSKKDLAGKTPKEQGEVLITTYCSDEVQYRSTKEVFRASDVAENMYQDVSGREALSNAKGKLAGFVYTKIQSVSDNYFKTVKVDLDEAGEKRFEGNIREIIKENLSNIRTICEKVTKTEKGKYKTYICIELSADDIAKAVGNKISTDKELKVDYDYEKFKKVFEEEMKKMENK